MAPGGNTTRRVAPRVLRVAFSVLRIAVCVSRMGVTVDRTPEKVLAPNERNGRNERKSCELKGIHGSERPCFRFSDDSGTAVNGRDPCAGNEMGQVNEIRNSHSGRAKAGRAAENPAAGQS